MSGSRDLLVGGHCQVPALGETIASGRVRAQPQRHPCGLLDRRGALLLVEQTGAKSCLQAPCPGPDGQVLAKQAEWTSEPTQRG